MFNRTFLSTLILLSAISVSSFPDSFNSRVSPGRATLESTIATLAPVGVGAALIVMGHGNSEEDLQVIGGSLCLLGAWFGPSFGHFYAQQPVKAGTGIAIRTAGLASIAVGTAVLAGDEHTPITAPGSGNSPATVIDEGTGGSDLGGAMILIGGSIIVASAIYDIATAGTSARKTNQSARFGATVDIGPVYMAQHGTPGIGLSLRF